jgi:hypothetical protein
MKIHPGKKQRGGERRGSALLMSLAALLVVAGLAAGYMQTSAAITKRQRQAVDTKQAFYVAEAGLSEAFSGMMIGRTGNVGSREEPALFGRGCFWVEAEEAGVNLIDLEATGLYGGGRATLSVVVEKGGQSVAALGIYSDEQLAVPDGTKVDAYDSSLGSYDSQVGGSVPLQLGSSHGISVTEQELSTEIHGDVVPGVGETVTVTGEPTITGKQEPRSLNPALPAVTVPSVSMTASSVHSSSTPLALPPGSYGYNALRIAPLAKVVLHGPSRVVFGNLVVDPTATIEFDTTLGKVDVFVTGTMTLGDGSYLATTGTDPSQVTIQLSGSTTSVVHPEGDLYGSIYGPEATVDFGGALELFGSLIAEEILLQTGTTIHFDQHLAVLGARSTLPTLYSWRIVDFAPLGPESDPFLVLGVNKSSLPPPRDAHQDQELDVTYRDLSGSLSTYSGMESDFNWTQVTAVESLTRDSETTALTTTKTRLLLASP